jgi:hypothetical protein
MTTVTNINDLLNDKLFQVIGSTPTSIAESLKKVDLKGKSNEGAQIFAISVFAAAVNKSTLETFLADSRFAGIRPLLSAALSIQGRSNMTALTLLGHCLLTTSVASQVNFTSEFRKKMGQDNLWSGTLDGGSLSDKQRAILKEKKRLTSEEEAKALGNGFLKHVGILSGNMNNDEAKLFGVSTMRSGSVSPTEAGPSSAAVAFKVSSTETLQVPGDVMNYRMSTLGQTRDEIAESLSRNGLTKFVANTRKLMKEDPTGDKTRSQGSVAR